MKCRHPEFVIIEWSRTMLRVGDTGIAMCPICKEKKSIRIVFEEDVKEDNYAEETS